MNEKQKGLIGTIIKKTVVAPDGTLVIDGSLEDCLFCQKKFKSLIPFRIVQGEQEFFVEVPMCKNHEKELQDDLYRVPRDDVIS